MSQEPDRIHLLTRILREQGWLLEELSGLLSAQLAAVRSGNREDLEKSTQQLESLNHLLEGVDSRRRRLLGSLSLELGLPVSELTIRQLATRSEPDTGRRLLDIAARLAALLTEIGARRAMLRQLLQKHSEHAGRGLDWLRRLAGLGTYGRDLRLSTAPATSRIIDRTA